MQDHSNAMWVEREPAIEVDDCDCFAPVRKWEKPVHITPVELGEILVEIVKPGSTVAFFAPVVSELDAMAADLALLQAGDVEPVVTMDAETLDAIESEAIGEAFSTQPYLY